MSEIQSLTARVQWLSDSVDRWNVWMVSALVVAAIAALFILLTTRMVVYRSKELATAQGLLSDAKDRKALTDSKDKDQKIADASRAAGEANERAAKANETAEDERIARVRLESELAPRRLSGQQVSDLETLLKKKTGAIVIVSAILDPESADFAEDISNAFKGAGWQTMRIPNRITTERNIEFGVVAGTDIGNEIAEISTILAKVGILVVPTTFKADDHTTSPWFQKGPVYLCVNKKPDIATMLGKKNDPK